MFGSVRAGELVPKARVRAISQIRQVNMTAPMMPRNGDAQLRPKVYAGQLWAGGVATAIVAALVAVVGILVCRWLFSIPILAPRQDGAYGDVATTGLALAAAAAALAATALAHLLLLSTPRPLTFFSWIVGLATVVVVLFPFSTSAPLSEKVATAAVDLVIGLAIGSLINSVGARSIRARRTGGAYPAAPSGNWQETGSGAYPRRPL
jgi:hypothetical protein